MATIELDDEQIDVRARVFRLFSRDGTAACTRSIWCRLDWRGDGWEISFYGTHTQRDAIQGVNQLQAIPWHVADLVAKAMSILKKIQAGPDTGKDSITISL